MTSAHLRGAVIGIVAFLGVAISAIGGLVYMGYAPMAADSAPSALEANIAMFAVHAVSNRAMGTHRNPLPLSEANLAAGLRIYGANCIMCHGAADGKPSPVAAGFAVPSPQFATDGAEDDSEGATFWKIHHGIRFTAMPAFMHSLTDEEIWRVTMFLKHMDHLPRKSQAAWSSMPSDGHMGSTAPMQMR